MQNYHVELSSDAEDTFFNNYVASSVDLDIKKKLSHRLSVSADVISNFSIGLIVGSSGSGKTSLARKMFGDFSTITLNEEKSIIDSFPDEIPVKERIGFLGAVGLTSAVCWITKIKYLSNGQKYRAQAAVELSTSKDLIFLDEWTSVLDRDSAKAASHSIQKAARKLGKKIVLISCHPDVYEWLNPCWVIDCNTQEYTDRRDLWRNFIRREKLHFEIRKCGREVWKMFSRYHYLSENLPVGLKFFYCLTLNNKIIGFNSFNNYCPKKKGKKFILHANRIVIHPDFCGFGLGLAFTEKCADILLKTGYEIYIKYTSKAIFYSMIKSEKWKLKSVILGEKTKAGKKMKSKKGFRDYVKTYSFVYIGE